jgi:hypothetical protein
MTKAVSRLHPTRRTSEGRRAAVHRGKSDLPDRPWLRAAAQKATLLALIDKCPEVIADLHDHVVRVDIDLKPMMLAVRKRLAASTLTVPVSREVLEWLAARKRLLVPREARWESRMDDFLARKEAEEERRRLDLTNAREWGLRWNLNAPCIIEWAVSVASELRSQSEWGQATKVTLQRDRGLDDFVALLRKALEYGGLLGTMRLDWFDGPEPHAVAPKPEEESESAFVKRAVAAYRAAHAQRGLMPRPERPQLGKHAEWLVLHQVKGQTEAAVAEQYQDPERGLDVATVSKAVTSLAKLIGLPLRPARRRVRLAASDPSR